MIAIINQEKVVIALYESDQPLSMWARFAEGLNATAEIVDSSVNVGDVYTGGENG